jgi:thiamine-phosphate pyrophosphorylase
LLTWWQRLMEIPCVAIGGITPENCTPLIEAGADFLAVSGAVWNPATWAPPKLTKPKLCEPLPSS